MVVRTRLISVIYAALAYSLTSIAATPPAANPSVATDTSRAPAPLPASPLTAVKLPATEGAWLVEVARSGGLANRYVSYSINSTGESLVSNAQGNARLLIAPQLLARVETQVRAAQTQAWVSVNDSCNDCQRTSINLSMRQAGGAVKVHSAGWMIGPSGSPSNALALVDAVIAALPNVPAVR